MPLYFAGPIGPLRPDDFNGLAIFLVFFVLAIAGILVVIIGWATYIFKRYVSHKPTARAFKFNIVASMIVAIYITIAFMVNKLSELP